jgi:hypothetical protein
MQKGKSVIGGKEKGRLLLLLFLIQMQSFLCRSHAPRNSIVKILLLLL